MQETGCGCQLVHFSINILGCIALLHLARKQTKVEPSSGKYDFNPYNKQPQKKKKI